MRQFLSLFLVLVFLVSLVGAEESEAKKLCDAEIKKETIDKSVIKEQCIEAGQYFEDKQEYGYASWYYLLGGANDKNINEVQSKITNHFVANIAHSYILNQNLKKAKVLYSKFLKDAEVPWADGAMQEDFQLLSKLYPKHKTQLDKGLALWNEIYKPLLNINTLYSQYREAKKKKEYQEAIEKMNQIIELQKNSKLQNKIGIVNNQYSLGILYYNYWEYEKSIEILIEVEKIYKLVEKDKEDLGFLQNWIAYGYRGVKQYGQSIKYAEKYNLLLKSKYGENSEQVIKTNLRIENLKLQKSLIPIKKYIEDNAVDKLRLFEKKSKGNRKIIVSAIKDTYYIIRTFDILKYLVSINYNLNQMDSLNSTLLGSLSNAIIIEDSEKIKMIEYLLANGAKIEYSNNNRIISNLYADIGLIYHNEDNISKALIYYIKSASYYKNIEQNTDVYANSYSMLLHFAHESPYRDVADIYYYEIGDNIKAYKYLRYSVDSFYLNNLEKILTLSVNIRDEYIKLFKEDIQWLFKIISYENELKQDVNVVQDIFSVWLNYKGTIFDSENAIVSLYANTKDKALKEKIDELLSNKRRLAKLYQTPARPKQQKEWKATIKEVEEHISTLTNAIADKAQSFKEAQGLNSISYKDISSNLKEDELYIDYAKADDRYYLFSLDSKEHITFSRIDENSTKKIDNLIKTFREDVNTIIDDGTLSATKLSTLTTESKEKLSELYKLLLGTTLSKEIKDKKSLIISPDGALRLFPFEAMFNSSNNRYLIEQKEIRYIPSGKELIRLYRYAKTNTVANPKTTIFSNPNFDDKSQKDSNDTKEELAITPNTNRAGIVKSLFRMRFSTLPGTQLEANAIKSILSSQELIEYNKEEATEANLMQVSQPNILHIATHGFFINDNSIPNPMLKSGIALSGANISAKQYKSNGIVTSLKLSGLDLKGTDLVVLSACETGVVDINSTDSVSGLSKAFIQAGAKDIVTSLWKVDDNATKDLMTSFYKQAQTQGNYAKALQEAKLEMIDANMHPFYWAGFVLSGL